MFSVVRSLHKKNNALKIVVKRGEEYVKAYLATGANINSTNNDETMLQIAIKLNMVDVVKLLLKQKVTDVNVVVPETGDTLLHLACKHTNVNCNSMIELLLKRYSKDSVDVKALFSVVNKDGKTPLHCIVDNVIKEGCIITFLVEEWGIDINVVGSKEYGTLLDYALMRGDYEVFKELYNYGGKVTSFEILNRIENLEMKSIILDYIIKNGTIEEGSLRQMYTLGRTIVHILVQKGNIEALQKFLVNTDINAEDSKGRTALHLAAKKGYVEILQVLIDAGANVNAVDKYGNTALHFAANSYDSNSDVIRKLIKHGANVNAKDNEDITALHLAAEKGYAEILQVLIDAGANVNAVDKYGRTALYMAAEIRCSVGIVQALINAGADVHVRGKEGDYDAGETVLMKAMHCYNMDVRVKIAEIFIKAGVEVNAVDDLNRTALHWAAHYSGNNEQGDINIVKLLLKYGASVDQKDINGYTALYIAKRECNQEIQRLICFLQNLYKGDVSTIEEMLSNFEYYESCALNIIRFTYNGMEIAVNVLKEIIVKCITNGDKYIKDQSIVKIIQSILLNNLSEKKDLSEVKQKIIATFEQEGIKSDNPVQYLQSLIDNYPTLELKDYISTYKNSLYERFFQLNYLIMSREILDCVSEKLNGKFDDYELVTMLRGRGKILDEEKQKIIDEYSPQYQAIASQLLSTAAEPFKGSAAIQEKMMAQYQKYIQNPWDMLSESLNRLLDSKLTLESKVEILASLNSGLVEKKLLTREQNEVLDGIKQSIEQQIEEEVNKLQSSEFEPEDVKKEDCVVIDSEILKVPDSEVKVIGSETLENG